MTQAVLAPRLTQGSNVIVEAWMRAAMGLSRRFYPVVGVLVLVTGVFLVLTSNGAFGFFDGFVIVGVVVIIASGALGGVVFTPLARKAADSYQAGSPTSRAIQNRIAGWGVVDTLLILFAMYAMVSKFGM